MARPNPNNYDKDSPMSPQSATSGNISYQTNVNRQKTKKWAEAKPVNYGGDDWGDDYDDYDPTPPPVSKPTGLRQKGQGMQSPATGISPIVEKKYGDLPPLPGASNSRERSNSFDADDEKRNFSNATIRQPSPPRASSSMTGPPTQFSQTAVVQPSPRNSSGPPLQISTQTATQPSTGLRKAAQKVSPVSGSPHPEILKPGHVNTGEESAASTSIVAPTSDTRTPSSDYHARRDFSPSAIPHPFSTQASPAPQNTESPTAGARFPPRKTSLSQNTGPELSESNAPAQAASKPWTAPRPASPGAAARSPATPTGKALPFIRPADIYRRIEEERERERQSLDSSRPSMDSIVGTNPGERPDSPARTQVRESSSDNLGSQRSRTSIESNDAESGQARPMLETVQERKSESGIEGFNAVDQALNNEPEFKETFQGPIMSENDRLDVEGSRPYSISPMLPDLNRISSFGMDMFSQSRPDEAPLSATRDTNATPTGLSPESSTGITTLHTQPSLGFRSVVNQAFERTDHSSTPNTPSSHAIGVSRNASESTGTDGISPIMSRVPSAAVRDRSRETSNPSKLGVVNEPISPDEPQQERLTDDVRGAQDSQHTVPSGSHGPARDSDDEPLEPPRPIGTRGESFRPSLPGGWTSYAESESSEAQTQQAVEQTQTPLSEVLPIQESHEEHDHDSTPRNSLPRHALDTSVAGAALGGVAGAALGRHDKTNPSGTPMSDSSRAIPSENYRYNPDPAEAHGRSLYSTSNLDPRLAPKLDQASQEIQLRPDVVNRADSEESSVPPSPAPKDTPEVESPDDESDSLPKPTVPLKQRTKDQVQAEFLQPPTRPEILPTLSTDTRPYDEENDKLRKEIVKSLGPGASEAGQHDYMFQAGLDDGPTSNQARESTYLPSEYDNYWATTAEGEEPLPAHAGFGSSHGHLMQERSEPVSPVATESPIKPEMNAPVVAPLSPRRPETTTQETQRPSAPQRFSWEEGSENVTVAPYQEPHSTVLDVEHGAQDTVNEPMISEPVTAVGNSHSEQAVEDADSNPEPKSLSDHHLGRDAAILAGRATVASATVTARTPPPLLQGERRLSLAEEKNLGVSSTSYPVSPTPPEDEHPANSPTPYFSPIASPFPQFSNGPPSTVSPMGSPAPVKQPLSPTAATKILTFREIVAISSPDQRIRAFDETRHRFANMDSGLTDWITKLQTQYPEHANASGAWGGSRLSAPPAASLKSKFGKSAASSAPPLQEPYYQQYLNASSPTTPPTPTRPGPSPGHGFQSGSQQGLSSGGNKMTTQQVQAKGKELLHTAGIFGGKAGKAGKGLLAKGKNKLRGAGGGDKTSQSPPPKPKNEKRSSWRSSGRHDSTPRLSKDSSSTTDRSRSQPGATRERDTPPPQLPPLAPASSFGEMGGAAVVADLLQKPEFEQRSADLGNSPQVPEPGFGITGTSRNESSNSNRVPESDTSYEERDRLNVPAPIGKYQPSWDPFNATPISEEDGVQYEEHSKDQHQRQFSSESGRGQGSLLVPTDTLPTSDRSNSSDAHFYDAHEDQAEIPNDWVMVTPEPEHRDASGRDERKDPEAKQSFDVPTTSILNRPRGSSYGVPSPPPSARAASFSVSPPPKAEPASTTAAVQPPQDQRRSIPSVTTRQEEPSIPDIARFQPPTADAEQLQSEDPTSNTFLPPIRRTSTFGLKVGPKLPKPRFSIGEDDVAAQKSLEQQKVPGHRDAEIAAAGIAAVVHHEQQKDPNTAATQHIETREAPRSPPSQAGANQNIQQEREHFLPQQPTSPRSPRQVPPPIDTSFNKSSPGSARPQLVQGDSSEYSSPPGPTRPQLVQGNSSNSSQRTIPAGLSQQQQPPRFMPPRASDVAFRPQNVESSHVEWKPNRPKVAPAPVPASPSYWKEQDIPPPRASLDRQNSWEPQTQRARGYSGSSASKSYTRGDDYGEKGPGSGVPLSAQQQKSFEQPPSAAQRYPDLFRPENPIPQLPREEADLPAHYYQEPIPRAAAFLPRQQTNEYQLPGVGPPSDEPRSAGSRRNSGFFKEMGGRLSRGSSRERRTSVSRDENMSSPTRPFESQAGDYAESEAPSENTVEQKKRRSGFFGGVKRGSTSALGPPVSQESVIAHSPGSQMPSRTDLLVTPQASPQHERKRSIFSSSSRSEEPKTKLSKLSRASSRTSSAPPAPVEEPGKKKRFSGFTGLKFGKSNSSVSVKETIPERPQPTRELSSAERQPLDSPGHLRADSQMSTPPPNVQSQSRRVLSKLTSSASSSPRQETKTRKQSVLGGLMGRRSQQQERGGSDDSRSQGSQPQLVQTLPAAQTYSDLAEQEPTLPVMDQGQGRQQSKAIPAPNPNQARNLPANRGRRPSRETEPQYDRVPIPGGYALVRGQGAIPIPTEYDPRGYNRQQIDPRYAQQGFANPGQGGGYQQPNGRQYQGQQANNFQPQTGGGRQPKPNLGALETYERQAPRRLSREEVAGRSPPKSPDSQQRPYQLSLPGDNEQRPQPISKSAPPPQKPTIKHDAIQRLQQAPTLRHPESPAGYPLPDGPFSPVNPDAQGVPNPSLPRWPSAGRQHQHQLHHQSGYIDNATRLGGHQHSSSLDESSGLDRSNTRRTAISAISGISDPQQRTPMHSTVGSLNVPGGRAQQDGHEDVRGGGVSVSRSSPTPPSPMATPDREVSPEPTPRSGTFSGAAGHGIKTTELHIRPPSAEDLYSASPRLPKSVSRFPTSSQNTGMSTSNGNVQQASNAGYGGGLGRGRSERIRRDQQEKILIGEDGQEIEVAIDENEPVGMSATSYPGQEWNPYAAGGFEEYD